MDKRMKACGMRLVMALALTVPIIAGTQTCLAQKTLSATTSARFRVVAPVGINGQDVPQALLTLRSPQEYAIDESSGFANGRTGNALNAEPADLSGPAMTVEAGGRSFVRIDPGSRLYKNFAPGSERKEPMILVTLTGN